MHRTIIRSYHLQRCVLAALVGILVCSPPASAQHGHQQVTVTDLFNIKELGSVALSPDGRQVMYSVRSIVQVPGKTTTPSGPDPERVDTVDYEYRTHLHIADALRPGDSRQLTRGDLSASDAAWHPDGDRIAFVRTLDDTPQIFILPLLGGEAYAVTDLESGATAPRWSPDGSQLLFASSLTADQIRRLTGAEPSWPAERAGRRPSDSNNIAPDPNGSVAEIRAWLDRNAAERRPRVFHRLNLHGETALEDAPKYRHWFVMEEDSPAAEPILVTRGYYSFGSADWMADGSRVIVSGKMSTDLHPDRVWDSELYTAAADGSGMQPFFAMDGYSVGSPVVAPDGNAVAFTARSIDDAGYAQNKIGILPLGDSLAGRLLTLDLDRSTSAPKWSPDGWHLYFTAASDGGFPLYRVPAFDVAGAPGGAAPESASEAADSLAAGAAVLHGDSTAAALDSVDVNADTLEVPTIDVAVAAAPPASGPRIERLTSFDRGIRSFDVGSAAVFYVATEVANPYELYASDTPFTADRRLTSHNAEWVSQKRLSFPEARTLEHDGREIHYWIMKPAFFDSAGTYPLLLQIHGGPSAMWGPGEASMWHEFQFFVSRGFGVVFSNPRGSGGYGYDFKRANFQDWGTGPAEDVLAVASEAAREPWLDPDRQVVTGGSYAGYLTAWIVGRDHRFKAAVAQRGVYDLGTFLGEGNAWRLVPTHFGGFPWNRDVDSTRFAAALSDSAEVARDTTAASRPSISADSALVLSRPADSLGAEVPAPAADSTMLARAISDVPSPVSEILIRNSPLTYVDQIRTPLLIIHGDLDLRTGVIQSEILYKSLKILDRPVEYVRYPNSGHELSRSGDPQLRMDRILRIYEFMERFIR